MSGIIAGIGFKAIASTALGGVWSGVKGVGSWLGSLDLVHLLLLVSVLFCAWQTFGRRSQHRDAVEIGRQLTTANTALTGARNDLAVSQANEAALEKAIATQNAAIADLGSKSAKQQQIASKAENLASQRAAEAEATSERLRQSSRSVPLKSAPACEPSDALKGQWK